MVANKEILAVLEIMKADYNASLYNSKLINLYALETHHGFFALLQSKRIKPELIEAVILELRVEFIGTSLKGYWYDIVIMGNVIDDSKEALHYRVKYCLTPRLKHIKRTISRLEKQSN